MREHVGVGEDTREMEKAREERKLRQPLAPELLRRCRELRRETTDAEKLLWNLLRDRQLEGAKFRRQHPFGPYILDFYCHEAKLAVELDGGQHDEEKQVLHDADRSRFLEREGIRVLRFWNNDVFMNTEGVLECILSALDESLTPTLSQRERESTTPRVQFEVFEPKTDREVPNGTVARARATCLCCGRPLTPDRVRAQLSQQRGGADVVFDASGHRLGGARLLAVVTLKPGEQGRHYRVAMERDYEALWKASKRLELMTPQTLPNGLSPIPDEPLPPIGTLGFRVQRYGMMTWGDLFTARQKLALASLASGVRRTRASSANRDAVNLLLGAWVTSRRRSGLG